MLQNLQRFAENYNNPYQDRWYSYLLKYLPRLVRQELNHWGYHELVVDSSVGRYGKLAEIPWLKISDPRVSKDAQSGYYVAALYSKDKSKVVLGIWVGYLKGRRSIHRDPEIIAGIKTDVSRYQQGLVDLGYELGQTTPDLGGKLTLGMGYEYCLVSGVTIPMTVFQGEWDDQRLSIEIKQYVEMYQRLIEEVDCKDKWLPDTVLTIEEIRQANHAEYQIKVGVLRNRLKRK
jgi:MrcB-like, N-terminal domain